MTVFDCFVIGLGYGATALGAVMLFGGVLMFLFALIGALINATEKDDDDDLDRD